MTCATLRRNATKCQQSAEKVQIRPDKAVSKLLMHRRTRSINKRAWWNIRRNGGNETYKGGVLIGSQWEVRLRGQRVMVIGVDRYGMLGLPACTKRDKRRDLVVWAQSSTIWTENWAFISWPRMIFLNRIFAEVNSSVDKGVSKFTEK